jgi:DNA-binding NarL/FixJ family response regulator
MGSTLIPCRVLVADDHALVREGIRLLIDAHSDMRVVAEASNGQEAWEKAFDLMPDVVVMDVSMPVLGGAEATQLLRTNCPEIKVLAISAYSDDAHVRQLLASGASGYLLKKAASNELANAIRTIALGGVYLDPGVAASVIDGYIKPPNPDNISSTLSPREVEVLTMIAYGYTNKEIADKLCLSVKTVEGHKARIGEKLGLKSRADVVRYALQRGLFKDQME